MNVPSSAEGWNPSSTVVFLNGLIKRTSFLRVLADLVKQLANLVSDSRNFASSCSRPSSASKRPILAASRSLDVAKSEKARLNPE
jgi:hypothetical protein